MRRKNALIMVDLQNDFCSGGSLAVPEGDQIISIANQLQPYFDMVIATQDWHPEEHISFATNHAGKKVGDIFDAGGISQVLWPDHCVQNTRGADFHPDLQLHGLDKIVHKGINKNIDSYSAFFDNAKERATGLTDYLREEGVEDVYIMGLATDYCVKYSVLDALHQGFNVYVIKDACRAVELNLGDSEKALEEMRVAGAHLISSSEILN